jgi:ABC-type sulfate transport system permease subunit
MFFTTVVFAKLRMKMELMMTLKTKQTLKANRVNLLLPLLLLLLPLQLQLVVGLRMRKEVTKYHFTERSLLSFSLIPVLVRPLQGF